MHELSICNALLEQVASCVASHGALGASRIVLRVGMLAGVEPALLHAAYGVSRAGTCAASAELIIENSPLRIRCMHCGEEREAQPADLACIRCGSTNTQLMSGDELQLHTIDLVMGQAWRSAVF